MAGFVKGVLIAFFIVIVVLQRGLIGGRWMGLIDAYHLRNFCLLGLFVGVLVCHSKGRFRTAIGS